MSAEAVGIAFVAIVMLAGIVGTVLPLLPGLWLVWVAALLYGLVAGFGPGGVAAMVLVTALLIGGVAASFYLPQRGAAGAGVPWWGQVLALAAAIAGFFLIPVVGAFLGFVLGILVVALVSNRDFGPAWAATKATLLGMLRASGVQLIAGILMALVWVAWVVWG